MESYSPNLQVALGFAKMLVDLFHTFNKIFAPLKTKGIGFIIAKVWRDFSQNKMLVFLHNFIQSSEAGNK